MEFSGIFCSPKTPVKMVTSKTRAARKDLVCSLCGMSLVGERCTFNVENHPGLRVKLESILEESINVTVQSSHVCRPCGRQMESLEKRYNVVMQQIREFCAKYSSSCSKMVSVKRLSKSSPSPKHTRKLAQVDYRFFCQTIMKRRKICRISFNLYRTPWNAATPLNRWK